MREVRDEMNVLRAEVAKFVSLLEELRDAERKAADLNQPAPRRDFN